MQGASRRYVGIVELLGLGEFEGAIVGEPVADCGKMDGDSNYRDTRKYKLARHCCPRRNIQGLGVFIKTHEDHGNVSNEGDVRPTLNQAGAALGHVFDEHIPAPVGQEAVEWGRLLVADNAVAHVRDAASPLGEDLDLIATGVVE